MKKRMGKAAALLMAVTMVCGMLAGCGSNGSEKAPETAKAQTEAGVAESGEAGEGGGTIVYGSNDYTRINPAMDKHGEINVLIFDGLTDHDGNNEVVPRLAKSWDYDEENSTYTFHLEEGVKWHDGEPFTAEDVKFTIEAIMDPANESENAPNYEDVESITVIDDHTIEFKLSAPNVAFLDYMTMPILPKHLLEGENMQESDFFRAPVGTGPFKLAKWDEGQQIVLEKNEDYFAGPAKIDSIIFKIVSDDNAKALQLKSGELNLAQVTPKDAVTFEGDDAYNVYTMSTSDYRGILYNFRNEYWQENADLIPAINYCIDRQAIIDAVLLGHGQIAYGPLQKNKYNCEDVEKYDFNLDKAAEAFTAAGCEKDDEGYWTRDGKRIGFTIDATPSDQVRIDMAQIAAQQLKEAGLDVRAEVPAEGIDWGGQECCIIGWGSPFDADDHTYKVFGTDKGANYNGYSNEKVDTYLKAARETTDENERMTQYALFQKELAKTPAFTFFCYIDAMYVGAKNISGIDQNMVLGHHGVGIFWNVCDWTISE